MPEDNIKVFDVKDKRGKFEGTRVRIGEWEDFVPLKFLLLSEMKNLEGLLRRAYNAGAKSGPQAHDSSAGSDLSSVGTLSAAKAGAASK